MTLEKIARILLRIESQLATIAIRLDAARADDTISPTGVSANRPNEGSKTLTLPKKGLTDGKDRTRQGSNRGN